MQELKHSGLGIASIVTSVISGILFFLMLVVAGVMETSTQGGINEKSPETIVIGLFMFACLGLALIALGLGVAGLFQKDRKKVMSVLGTIFSGVTVFVVVFIVILGLAVK